VRTANVEHYEDLGYVVIRSAISERAIDEFMSRFVRLTEDLLGCALADPHSEKAAVFWNENKATQSQLYDRIREPSWLVDFCSSPEITGHVKELAGERLSLMRKIPFRIDAPLETAQYAAWHQDYFYVRGNTEIVTAWIPMQETEYVHGCLTVMPGSHRLGPVAHPRKVIGKRDLPTGIFDREVRYIEMKKGDLLLFHSCLLHSSSLNLSGVTRYSIQARYSPAHLPTDTGMGSVVSV
jgi:ectoine hydroxylase-related dioxygenase (phytanoyl-CoA dioxygenase family)